MKTDRSSTVERPTPGGQAPFNRLLLRLLWLATIIAVVWLATSASGETEVTLSPDEGLRVTHSAEPD